MWRIKQFFRNIHNLIYYFKVIWNDRDWDHSYIEYILLAKYKKQYKRLVRLNKFVDSKTTNKALKICIDILQRRKDSWYNDTYFYLMHNDVIWDPVVGENDLVQISESWNISNDMELYNKKSNEARLVEERDWKLYCNIVEKYYNNWWD